jgi:hypothetical protein
VREAIFQPVATCTAAEGPPQVSPSSRVILSGIALSALDRGYAGWATTDVVIIARRSACDVSVSR